MKKLIILTILCVGMSLSSQAQSLNVQALNTSSDTWKVKVYNAVSTTVVNMNMAPGTAASGSASPAAFPLKVQGSSSGNCTFLISILAPMAPTSVVTFTDSCGNSHLYAATKTPNGNYAMKLLLN